jgi:hypothetical protein
MRMLVRIASWAGVLFIAGLAFWVSYHAIKGVWITSGAGRPQDAWAIPLMVDGCIIVGSLVALARALDGVRGRRAFAHPWGLVGAMSLVSLIANVAHAAPHFGPRAFASLVPLILLGTTELVVAEMHRTRKPASPAPAPAPALSEAPYARTGPAPVDVAAGGQGSGAGDRGGGGRVASTAGAGVAVPAVERPGGRVGATVATHPVGAVEDPGGADWATVGGVGPDTDAPGGRGGMTIGEAVRYLIDVDGVNPHRVTPGRIADDVRRLTRKPAVSTGAIGNALSTARKNASSNGGARVR